MRLLEGNWGGTAILAGMLVVALVLIGYANYPSRTQPNDLGRTQAEVPPPIQPQNTSTPKKAESPWAEPIKATRPVEKPKGIEGMWTNVAMELGGKNQDKADQSGEMEITRRSLTMHSRGEKPARFSIDLYPDKRPPQIDIRSWDGAKIVFLGIYRIEADQLTICWRPARFGTPTEFKTTWDTGDVMFTLKRK